MHLYKFKHVHVSSMWRPIQYHLCCCLQTEFNQQSTMGGTLHWSLVHITMVIILILKHAPLYTFWNARVLCNSYRSGSFIGDLPNSMHNLVALPSSLQPGWTCFSQKWGLSPTRPRMPPTYMKHYHIIHHHARWHSGPCWGKGLYNEN